MLDICVIYLPHFLYKFMMNIVLATDDNYVQHCCSTMVSVLTHNDNVHFFILTEGLKDENRKLMSNFVNSNGGQIDYCVVDSSVVSQFPMPKEGGTHISIATYYRLFVDILLPGNIKKVLYLDCDIIVTSSLIPLYSIDMQNYAIGAVYQNYNKGIDADLLRLGIPNKEGYFNAGVLMINLEYWRKNDTREKLIQFIKHNFTKIKQHDQDVLNAVLWSKTIPLSNTWNYQYSFKVKHHEEFPSKVKYVLPLEDPAVIHYVSVPKPWEWGCGHIFVKEYYKYLEMTPFRGWKPKFNWKRYKEYILVPKIIKIILAIDFLKIRRLVIKQG